MEDATRQRSAVQVALREAVRKTEAMQRALSSATVGPGDLDSRLHRLRQDLLELDGELYGSASKRQVGEKTRPTIGDRLQSVSLGVSRSTYGPTPTHRQSLDIATTRLDELQTRLEDLQAELASLSEDLIEAGAPWVEGAALPD